MSKKNINSVLSKEDVDTLMRGINESDFDDDFDDDFGMTLNDFMEADISKEPLPELTLETLEQSLLKRHEQPEPTYGMYSRDVSMLKFFDTPRAEEVLADIRAKNQQKGLGNFTVPGTQIELINFSYCPRCEAVYDFDEVQSYYRRPVPIEGVGRSEQLRNDTRMNCYKECKTFFFPTLVISDGTPKSEVQFLCRMQTIEAIEQDQQHNHQKAVLTRKPANLIKDDQGRSGVINDLTLQDLAPKPGLLSNLLQYTPAPLALSFLNNEHRRRSEVIFGVWK